MKRKARQWLLAVLGGAILLLLLVIIVFSGRNNDQPISDQNDTLNINTEIKSADISSYLQSNLQNQSSTLPKLELSSELIGANIPTNLNTFINVATLKTTSEWQNEISMKLGVVKNEEAPFDVWTGNGYEMNHIPTTDVYTIYNKSAEGEGHEIKIDTKAAEESAMVFWQNLFPNVELVSVMEKTEFLTRLDSDYQLVNTTIEDATRVRIYFVPTVDNYPYYLSKNYEIPYQVLVNGKNEIVQARFTPQNISPFFDGARATIKISDAVANINAGQGLMLAAIQNNGDIYTQLPGNTLSGIIGGVAIEYRYIAESNALWPFYNFNASIQDSGGNNYEATIITPAADF